ARTLDWAADEASPFCPQSDGLTARRERPQRRRKPAAGRLDAAPHRRHGSGSERPGGRGGDHPGPAVARAPVGRGPGAPERALGATSTEFVHHGLILGDDGKKLAKRAPGATVASLRDAGIPGSAVRRYLEELGAPQHDVHYDLSRIRRLAIEAIESMSDEELAA